MDFFRTRSGRQEALTKGTTQSRPLDLRSARSLTSSSPDWTRRELLPGGTLLHGGRYVIESVLGTGGEGVVYHAYDDLRRQPVALKVLHVDDLGAVPQLKREFRVLRDLIHPNLVPLYELVVDRELSFFTMAFVEGHEFLEGVCDEDALRARLFQLADVLSFLHETGRVHRDVKPSNVLVRETGEVVLLDFGVALDLGRPGQKVHGVIGTPRYMAPEVLALGAASPKSDAYSVGVLLYEALTGRHPEPSERTDPTRTVAHRPSDALAAIPADLDEVCTRLLDPDPDRRMSVHELFEALETHELAASFERPTTRSHGERALGQAYSGREQELARLDEALGRMHEGSEPLLVVLEAPSGLGKTATLNCFLDRHPEALVLRGRCSEHELVPHKAIDGVLEALVAHLATLDQEDVLSLVPAADASILVQLFPELGRVGILAQAGLGGGPVGDTRALRQRAYLALGRLLAHLGSEHTLVIAIDDLQWGDVDSGKLLLEVFAGPERPRCLLVLAHRSGDAEKSACLSEVLGGEHRLDAALVTTKVRLSPLLDRDSRALVHRLLPASRGDEALTHRIVRESGGSPLLLTEIATQLASRGLEQLEGAEFGIDAIVQARLSALTPEVHHAFGLLCCSGRPLAVRVLSELSRAAPDAAARSLEAARLARGRDGGQRLEVLHDAIRESMLRQLGARARVLHGELGRALEVEGGDPAEIARHYDASGQGARASYFAEVAAEAASASFALEHAVELYRLALRADLPDKARDALLEKLADALADSGKGAEAAPLYAALAERAPLEQQKIELRRRAAEQWLITGGARQGRDVLARVQKEVGLSWPHSPGDALRTVLIERARLRLTRERALNDGRPLDERSRAQLAACRAAWSVSFISTIHGAANSSRYLRLALEAGDQRHVALGYGMEAMYRATSGTKQRALIETYLSRARALISPNDGYGAGYLRYADGQCNYLLGNFADAVDGYADAERQFLGHCRNVSWELNSGRIFWSSSLFYLGRHKELDAHYSAWQADAVERGDKYIGSAIGITRARRTIIKDGNREAAEAEVDAGAAEWVSPYMGFHYFAERIVRAHVRLAAQRPELALAVMRESQRDLKRSHMGRVQVVRVYLGTCAAFAAIELAADAGSPNERAAHLALARRVAKALAGEKSTWATAVSEQVFASAALIEAPTEAALARLERARDLYAELDMVLFAVAVDARVGELSGGDTGREKCERAHAAFADVGACDWVSALSGFSPRILPR